MNTITTNPTPLDLSTITPPVCGAVFIAAGMVGDNWLKVAITSMALGIGLYLIPLTMIAQPNLLKITSSTIPALVAFALVGTGLACLSFALISKVHIYWRLTLIAISAATVFYPAIFSASFTLE